MTDTVSHTNIKPNPSYEVILCTEVSITKDPGAILDNLLQKALKHFKVKYMKPNPLCYKLGVWGCWGYNTA